MADSGVGVMTSQLTVGSEWQPVSQQWGGGVDGLADSGVGVMTDSRVGVATSWPTAKT